MKVQFLISKNSWANKYKNYIKNKTKLLSKNITFFINHKKLKKNYDINFIFSYFKKIENQYLKRSKHNLILHESNLPKGRGMSPITWQILSGHKYIVFSLINAEEKIDSGEIYYQKKVMISKTKLFDEIKKIQLDNNLNLILRFLKHYKKNKKKPLSKPQIGKATYYKTRKPSDSKINFNKSIKSQFNLLRVCDFENYPAYFFYKKKKFLIKLEKKNK